MLVQGVGPRRFKSGVTTIWVRKWSLNRGKKGTERNGRGSNQAPAPASARVPPTASSVVVVVVAVDGWMDVARYHPWRRLFRLFCRHVRGRDRAFRSAPFRFDSVRSDSVRSGSVPFRSFVCFRVLRFASWRDGFGGVTLYGRHPSVCLSVCLVSFSLFMSLVSLFFAFHGIFFLLCFLLF